MKKCSAKHERNSKGYHAHHILAKGSHGYSTRWNLDNGVGVCYGCHSYLQSHPEENERFAREFLGIDYDYLNRLGKQSVKVFYNEMKAELEEMLADIEIGQEMKERGE